MAVVCKECYWCARHVGGINLWGNIVLLVVKLLGGLFGRSQALIADAIHSLSDVVVSVLLIISLKVSASPPDEDHPWGHGNVEFIVSAIFGTLLVCAAVAITAVSITSIVQGNVYDTSILAVWAAVISVVANEIMFRHSLCVGRQVDSPVMIANAWENRADVWSLGIKGMTDRSFDKAMLKQVKRIVMAENAVRDVSRLRARQIGQQNWIDIEAIFDPQIKVSEVKRIIRKIKKNVMDKFERVGDVVIVSRVSETQLKEM